MAKRRITKAEAAKAAAILAAEEAAKDAGFDYYKDHHEAMLIEVYLEASHRYTNKNEAHAFVDGFVFRRTQSDEYRKEWK
jgi:hypothetical protein